MRHDVGSTEDVCVGIGENERRDHRRRATQDVQIGSLLSVHSLELLQLQLQRVVAEQRHTADDEVDQ